MRRGFTVFAMQAYSSCLSISKPSERLTSWLQALDISADQRVHPKETAPILCLYMQPDGLAHHAPVAAVCPARQGKGRRGIGFALGLTPIAWIGRRNAMKIDPDAVTADG